MLRLSRLVAPLVLLASCDALWSGFSSDRDDSCHNGGTLCAEGYFCDVALRQCQPVVPLPAPELGSVVPVIASNRGGVALRLNGKALQTAATISFDGVAGLMTTWDSSALVRTTVPPSARGYGPVSLTLANPDGQAVTGGDLFAYFADQPFSSAPNGSCTGSGPYSVVAADLNKDGRIDLAIANNASADVSVLLGDGTGGFGSSRQLAAGDVPVAIASGDFNADGKPDLVCANLRSNNISVFLGDGQGDFARAQFFATGPIPTAVGVADFNRDGNLDVATTNYGGGLNGSTVSVLWGDGLGGFLATSFLPAGSQPFALDIGDINGDAFPDIVAVNSSSSTASIFLGNGSGGFNPTLSTNTRTGPQAVLLRDFTGDGRADLAVANRTNSISILVGNGSGGFGAPSNIIVGLQPTSLAARDLNGDGQLDLLVTNGAANSTSLLYGTGTGAFTLQQNLTVGLRPNSIAVADVNGN